MHMVVMVIIDDRVRNCTCYGAVIGACIRDIPLPPVDDIIEGIPHTGRARDAAHACIYT